MGRERTKYQGVYQRQHATRRHLGRPDVCYEITYKTPDRKKVWEKVGWASEEYTAQMASKIRSERLRQMRHGDVPGMSRKRSVTLDQAFDRYKHDWLCNVKSAGSDESRYARHLKPGLGKRHLSDISPLDVERLKNDMTAKGYSAQTVKHTLGLLRRIYRKLRDWELFIGSVPTDKVRMPRVDSARTRYLTEDEAARLLAALRQRSRMWHDIALLSLASGMRLGEILSLRWADVDVRQRHVHVRDAKSGSRTTIVNRRGAAMLRLRRCGQDGAGLVFPARGSENKPSAGASHTYDRVVEELELNKGVTDRRHKVVFHTLRHTFASWLAIRGTPLYVIGELLGHSSLEMTKRYSHLCPDVKKDAVRSLNGAMRGKKA